MHPYLGDFATGSTVYVPFSTFGASGESLTLTGLAVGDVKIYKNASMTERSSTAGITLMDTDGIDLDTRTGIHGFSIDLSDNTDAGFYAAGNEYFVVVDSVTINAQTVRFVACQFSIERSGGALAVVKARLPAALVSGRIDASVGAMAANVITTTAINDGAFTNGKFGAGAISSTTVADGFITAAKLASDAITAAKLAADVTTELQSGLATAANLAIVAGYLDTEIAAILAVTNKLDTALENDGGVYRFTTNALEQAPSGSDDVFVIRQNTAQAGAAQSITLDPSASSSDNAYRRDMIFIISGTGAGQSNQIDTYDGTSKVADVIEPWDIVPDGTSIFVIAPFGVRSATVEALATAVWAAQRLDNAVAGSFGEKVNAGIIDILGDATSATELRNMLNGTGTVLTNVSIPGIEDTLNLIQNVTDEFTFTVGGQVDCRVVTIRNTPVTGGDSGPWGRT